MGFPLNLVHEVLGRRIEFLLARGRDDRFLARAWDRIIANRREGHDSGRDEFRAQDRILASSREGR
jgi:hypothetical protein